jgi:hypothetical protein
MIWVDSIPLQGNEDDFGIPMLAPDNKIYISTYHGVQAMHVINYPDSLGTACGFVKLGLTLPSYNVYSIPNHTNYDLGPVEGSSCDTLYLSPSTLPSSIQAFKISPNPVSASLNIVYNAEEDAFFQLTDIYGKRAAANSLFHYFKNRLVNVSGLPAGVYFATVTQKGKMIWSERVVITR